MPKAYIHLVHVRSNNGEDSTQEHRSFDDAHRAIRQATCASNIMIRLQINGRMVLRWDRVPGHGVNRWRSVDMGAALPITETEQT